MPGVSEVERRRFALRARFASIAAAMITVLLSQLVVAFLAVVEGRESADAATRETFASVGDATMERVVRYFREAEFAVDDTAAGINNGALSIEDDTLQFALYQQFRSHPYLRALYVGYPNGDFLMLQRAADGDGYTVRHLLGGEDPAQFDQRRDSHFQVVGADDVAVDFDPRTRPWWQMALASDTTVWTDPYFFFTDNLPGTTVAERVDADGELVAVVGADVGLGDLGQILSSLPLGESGEAFVLGEDRTVIAAPTQYADQLDAFLAEGISAVHADEIGVSTTAEYVPGGTEFSYGENDGLVTLEMPLPAEYELPWVLHLRAEPGDVAPQSEAFERTMLSIAITIVLLLVVSAGVIVWAWGPLTELRRRAATDYLTGVLNRHEFELRGDEAAADLIRGGHQVLAAIVDIDGFKAINDSHGHVVGDAVLRAAAGGVESVADDQDVVGRVGGDSFAIVMRVHDAIDVQLGLEVLRREVLTRIDAALPEPTAVGVTVGFAYTDRVDATLDMLMDAADGHLLAGKGKERGKVYGERL